MHKILSEEKLVELRCAFDLFDNDNDGKIDPAKLKPVIFDPVNHTYIALGKTVGKAFSDGMKLK